MASTQPSFPSHSTSEPRTISVTDPYLSPWTVSPATLAHLTVPCVRDQGSRAVAMLIPPEQAALASAASRNELGSPALAVAVRQSTMRRRLALAGKVVAANSREDSSQHAFERLVL